MLKPEVSLPVGLATGALVWAIYQGALPPLVDTRVVEPGDRDLAGAERSATWTAAAIVSGISLIAKDPTVFVLGGSLVVAMAWLHRYSAQINPATGRVDITRRETTNAMSEEMA